jgi:hypothetical protein
LPGDGTRAATVFPVLLELADWGGRRQCAPEYGSACMRSRRDSPPRLSPLEPGRHAPRPSLVRVVLPLAVAVGGLAAALLLQIISPTVGGIAALIMLLVVIAIVRRGSPIG